MDSYHWIFIADAYYLTPVNKTLLATDCCSDISQPLTLSAVMSALWQIHINIINIIYYIYTDVCWDSNIKIRDRKNYAYTYPGTARIIFNFHPHQTHTYTLSTTLCALPNFSLYLFCVSFPLSGFSRFPMPRLYRNTDAQQPSMAVVGDAFETINACEYSN